MTRTFELNGTGYETDTETSDLLRQIFPEARETNDFSAVIAVLTLGEMSGRIRQSEAPKSNTEVVTNAAGNEAAVITTNAHNNISVGCYVDWKGDQLYVRSRTFKTRRGANQFASRFFDGRR